MIYQGYASGSISLTVTLLLKLISAVSVTSDGIT